MDESKRQKATPPLFSDLVVKTEARVAGQSDFKRVSVRSFKPGAQLFTEPDVAHRVGSVPQELRSCVLVATPDEDVGLRKRNYMALRAQSPCVVYVAVHEFEAYCPKWLHANFRPAAECPFVGVEWAPPAWRVLLARLTGVGNEFSEARLRVWRLRTLLRPGAVLRLDAWGRRPTGQTPSVNYRLLLRRATPAECVSRSGDADGVAAYLARVTAGRSPFSAWVLRGAKLWHAVRQGDIAAAQAVIDSGPTDVDFPGQLLVADDGGTVRETLTPLSLAARLRHTHICVALLRAGVRLEPGPLRFVVKELGESQPAPVATLCREYMVGSRFPMRDALLIGREVRRQGRFARAFEDAWEASADRFVQVAARLAKLLAGPDDDRRMVERGQPPLKDVLEPRKAPTTAFAATAPLNPLALAIETEAFDVFSSPAVMQFVENKWGGHDYTEAARLGVGGGPTFVADTLIRGGFASGLLVPPLRLVSFLTYICISGYGRLQFESPRGRFVLYTMSQGAMLVLYEFIAFSYPSTTWTVLHWTFGVFLIGAVVQELQEFASDPRGYTSDSWNLADMIGLSLLCSSYSYLFYLTYQVASFNQDSSAELAFTVFAMGGLMLYIRMFQALTSSEAVGPLITVIGRMARKLANFLLLLAAMMIAFASLSYHLFSFSSGVEPLTSYWTPYDAVITSFRAFLGDADLLEFDSEVSYRRVLGQLVLTSYLLVVGIGGSNLLVTLMIESFDPSESRARFLYNSAELMANYQEQVERNSLPNPFNIAALLCQWFFIDAGDRSRFRAADYIDGAPVPGAHRVRYPLGAAEIPFMVYNLIGVSVLLAVHNALALVLAPFLLLHKTWHEVFVREDSSGRAAACLESAVRWVATRLPCLSPRASALLVVSASLIGKVLAFPFVAAGVLIGCVPTLAAALAAGWFRNYLHRTAYSIYCVLHGAPLIGSCLLRRRAATAALRARTTGMRRTAPSPGTPDGSTILPATDTPSDNPLLANSRANTPDLPVPRGTAQVAHSRRRERERVAAGKGKTSASASSSSSEARDGSLFSDDEDARDADLPVLAAYSELLDPEEVQGDDSAGVDAESEEAAAEEGVDLKAIVQQALGTADVFGKADTSRGAFRRRFQHQAKLRPYFDRDAVEDIVEEEFRESEVQEEIWDVLVDLHGETTSRAAKSEERMAALETKIDKLTAAVGTLLRESTASK